MYLIFYNPENNAVLGKGHYSNPKHIPDQCPYLEITEELFNSEYPLEIYKYSGKLIVRINQAEKAKMDAEKAMIQAIKEKVQTNKELTNLEMAKLLMSKT